MSEPKYQVQLMWNREFYFTDHGTTCADLDAAITKAKAIEGLGDGAAVKKIRVVDTEGRFCWAHGKLAQS